MKKSLVIRKGARAWELFVAPDRRIPAAFWGAYARPSFADVLAIHDEAIAAARAFEAELAKGNDRTVTRG